MKKEEFKSLVKKLKGLNYCFFSGFAMFLLTKGKRNFNDIDILIDEEDIHKLAKRLGTKAQKRRIDKGTHIIEDIGFETNFMGQEIEAVTSKNKGEREKLKLTFENKKLVKYKDQLIFIEPIEELIVRKAHFSREKDLADIKLISNKHFNKPLVEKFAENWGNKEEIIKKLKELGVKYGKRRIFKKT
ncbi:MAG: nucleotidyltransferase family protein [Nanoarchaeota archaeon]|nr:nucleotidyltransferase family protein [Nanoarchaeota archaeon]